MEKVKSKVSLTVEKNIEKVLPHSRDRKLYLLFWFIVGAASLAYFIYVAIKCADAYKNPGASIEVDPVQPNFPVFAICYEDGFTVDTWDGSTGDTPTLNPIPTVIAYYNFTGDFFGLDNIKLTGKSFYYIPQDVTNYCYFGCNCFQFNHNKIIKSNVGKVSIYATGKYQKNASRSVGYLLIRSQDYGSFPSSTQYEFSTDDNYDILNLPTGTYVDASWTLSKHVSIQSWAPYKEKTQSSYLLVQQVEPLTQYAGTETLQGLALESDYLVCSNLQENATCTTGGFTGYCDNSTETALCAWMCPDFTGPIPLSWRCDGFMDCYDNSDEQNCTTFTCGDGTQIFSSLECNGIENCADSSDEKSCPYLNIITTVSVYPYTKEVTIIKAQVTFGWDVALAAFKAVLELGLAAMAFLFPAYFVAQPEQRRFILTKGKPGDNGEGEASASEMKSAKSEKSLEQSPEKSPEKPPEKSPEKGTGVEMETLTAEE